MFPNSQPDAQSPIIDPSVSGFKYKLTNDRFSGQTENEQNP